MTEVAPPTPNSGPNRNTPAGRIALVVAVLFAGAVTAYLFLSGGDDDVAAQADVPISQLPGAPTPFPNTGVLEPFRPKVDSMAPDFALIDARDGRTVRKLSDFRGKVVILNWYASWCGPCKNEIPEFQKAADALGDQLVVLGVDWLENGEKATSILNDRGGKYTAVLDNNGAIADHYRVQAMPTTFFIDKDGILRAMKTGEVFDDTLAGFLAKAGVTYQP